MKMKQSATNKTRTLGILIKRLRDDLSNQHRSVVSVERARPELKTVDSIRENLDQ